MRKLASIRKIKEIKEHKNADALELAIVDGWQCVVKKGEFKPGDVGVYFEIDSFLPLGTFFDFLSKNGIRKLNNKEGIRLKTIRLRGELSQGLMLPLSVFNDLFNDFENGTDVTDILNIDKYEQPIPASLAGEVQGNFPSFIQKTDQERIQNLFDDYSEKHNDLSFEATMKLDGTSMTCFAVNTIKFKTKNMTKRIFNNEELDPHEFGVCSRNFELKEKEENTYWKVANRDIKEKLLSFVEKTGKNIAVQGELMGPGIQGNREKLNDFVFYVFDIWDIDNQKYFSFEEKEEIINELEFKKVPLLFKNLKVFKEFKTLKEILKFAEGKSIFNEIREGIVFKSTTYVDGQIISFKAISNLFLEKEKD